MTFKICVIKPNKITFTEEQLVNNFNKNTIYETNKNYINFIDTTDDDLMIEVIKYLELENFKYKNSITIETTTVYEDENFKYDMCHLSTYDNIDMFDSQNGNSKQFKELCNRINKELENRGKNSLAGILHRNQFNTFGNAVIIKMDINNNKITNSDFNIDNFNNLVNSNLFYNGVRINVNNNGENSIENFIYVKSPLEIINPDKILNYRYHEIDLSSRILMIFIELKPEINIKNKIGSMFFNNPVVGNVIFALRKRNQDIRFDHHLFIDLNNSLLEKISVIYNYNTDNYELQKEDGTKDYVNGVVKDGKYINFYTNINQKYNEYIKTKFDDIMSKLNDSSISNIETLNKISLEQVEKSK